MKRILASVGLAAVSAASVQSLHAQADTSKAWTVSTSLRGFYDDNVNTTKTDKVKVWGFEVSPSIGFNLSVDQTDLSFAYTYAYKRYDHPVGGATDKDDQTHTFAAKMRHTFSERTTLSVADSFVVGQEPDVLRTGTIDTSLQRISGENIRNYGSIILNHQVTQMFGLEAGYANAYYDYEDEGGSALAPSNSGLLDRMEHTAHLDARWTVQPETVVLVGYQFNLTEYNGDENIGVILPATIVKSNVRNSRSHYGYAGVEHTFRPDLTGSVRAGARFTDNYNSPNNDQVVAPYVSAALSYKYAKDSQASIGVTHDRSATDQFSVSGDSVTSDSDSTVVYGSITHCLMPNLYGSLSGQYQYSEFNGGSLDNKSERFYVFGANLEYRINRHISANVGYNYDRRDSDQNTQDFDRNRVYAGATVTY